MYTHEEKKITKNTEKIGSCSIKLYERLYVNTCIGKFTE